MLILPRRKFLTGAAALFCAPAIIRVADLMPIKVPRRWFTVSWYQKSNDDGEIVCSPFVELLYGNDIGRIELIGNGWSFHTYSLYRKEGTRIAIPMAGVLPQIEQKI